MIDYRDLLLDTDQTREALNDALEYLDDCGIFVPDFRHRIEQRWGGSYVDCGSRKPFMRLGCYPTSSTSDWFTMHELAHVLVDAYDPGRRAPFRKVFGSPEPDEYDDQQWKARFPRRLRPRGFPSYYGRDGGGEEHFAELVAFMYTAERQFASRAPADLRRSWNVAWEYGLSRMTRDDLR